MRPEKLDLLIVSDLHAHSDNPTLGAAPSFLSTNSLYSAINPILKIPKLIQDENLSVDWILCPGDLGDGAKPDAQAFAWQQLSQLKQELSASHLIATTGNHDVDSRRFFPEFDPKGSLQQLTPTFPMSLDCFETNDGVYADRFWSRIIRPPLRVYGLTMPGKPIHSLGRNIEFSKRNDYRIIDDFAKFSSDELRVAFSKRRSRGALRIGFDISSVNRLLLIGMLHEIAMLVEPDDSVTLFYTPAAYADPSWTFPQIQKVGPVNELFSGFNGDLSKPLAAMLGLGFEAGVSMGIITQLEPNASVCLWGRGLDERFDAAVKTANFDFSYPGFATRVMEYSLTDPRGSFDLFESITYDLVQDHRLVVGPMGPKLFTALAALLAMTYFGEISIWRVQHSHVAPVDAVPANQCIYADVRVEGLVEYARKVSLLLMATG